MVSMSHATGGPMSSRVSSVFLQLAVLSVFVVTVAGGCGSGGSGASSSGGTIGTTGTSTGGIPSVPFIEAVVGTSGPQTVWVDTDSGMSTPITTALVTINGTTLVCNSGRYVGNVAIAAGATVNLSVTIGSTTYTAIGTQYATFPSITAPTPGATWQAASANTINWTAGVPTTGATYFVRITGNAGIVYPAGNQGALFLPTSSTSYVVPANSITTAGGYYVDVGIETAEAIPISNAAPTSGLWISGETSVLITVL